MILLQQMTILFLIMLIGLICRKRGLITDEGSSVLSKIVVNVSNPALILSAGMNKATVVEGRDLLTLAAVSLGMYVFLILISWPFVRILRLKKHEYGTFRVMTVFSNIGFMGFPLISAVYGSEALLYASFFVIPYNVLIYTWGIALMKKGDKQGDGEREKLSIGKIFNIGVIACILTIILYLGRIRVPGFLESTVSSLSALTAPLSMIVIGDSLAKMKIRELLTDKKILLFSLIKQLLIPVAGVFLLGLLGLDDRTRAVCMVMLATPVGSMTAMLAQQYDGEYDLASKGVALTTLLSVATMPCVALITRL
ncbi:MAG: AEC family transporter [Lachnospiraceae bacterium]|nr:AEC family transporter [Lachnospiraceae bacterium]